MRQVYAGTVHRRPLRPYRWRDPARRAALSANRHEALRRRIQMVFQDPILSLNPRMTVSQTVGEILARARQDPAEGCSGRRRRTAGAGRLSRGAQERLPAQPVGRPASAREYRQGPRGQPEILLADEPVSALDVSVQATILNLLDDLRRAWASQCCSSPTIWPWCATLSDRVAVMYLGRIVESAPAEEIFTDPRHPYTVALLSAVPRLEPGNGVPPPAVVGDPPSPINLPQRLSLSPSLPTRGGHLQARGPHRLRLGLGMGPRGGLPLRRPRRPARASDGRPARRKANARNMPATRQSATRTSVLSS